MFKILNLIRVSAFTGMILMSGMTLAQGGYIGGGVGVTSPDVNTFDDGTGFQFFGGYNFNANFGLEGGYVDMGEFDQSGAPPGNFNSIDGLYAALVLGHQFSNGVAIKGKIGSYWWDFDARRTGRPSTKSDGSSLLLAAGLDYYFNRSVGIGVEYSLYDDVGGADLDAFWLNLIYRFPR